jgi:secondary thiamine-phosphate synthase enzyme
MALHVQTQYLELDSPANGVVTAIGPQVSALVEAVVESAALRNGIVCIFAPSATSSITTLEYEPGAVSDLQRLFDEVAAQHRTYMHNENMGDGNGHAHVRAALFGPSLTVPLVDGRLTLGRYQEIVYLDFDNRPRQRRLVVQILGE